MIRKILSFGRATVGFASLMLSASNGFAAPAIDIYRGSSRVLILSAPDASDPALEKETQQLQGHEAGLHERDMVVIRAVGNQVTGAPKLSLDANRIRRAAGLPADRFSLALIGKDGSVVLKQFRPVAIGALFRTIDAMPMRREEMAAHAK